MIDPVDAIKTILEWRKDEVIIAAMGAARDLLKLSQHPRNLIYVPSSMGQAPTVGLGIALARPDLRIVVLNGDGCLLMNLGCLVTISSLAPANYALVNMDNGVYEVTGGQPTAAKAVDFAAIARGAGMARSLEFDDLSSWKLQSQNVLLSEGPVFANLKVGTVTADSVSPTPPCPMPQQLKQFCEAL